MNKFSNQIRHTRSLQLSSTKFEKYFRYVNIINDEFSDASLFLPNMKYLTNYSGKEVFNFIEFNIQQLLYDKLQMETKAS